MFYGGGYPPTLSQQHQIQQQQQQQQQQQLAGMQQATQRPQIKDEDVSRLQEMFPTLDTDVVRSVLEAHHGVADSAVTALLQMTET
jgi:phosphomannomutase